MGWICFSHPSLSSDLLSSGLGDDASCGQVRNFVVHHAPADAREVQHNRTFWSQIIQKANVPSGISDETRQVLMGIFNEKCLVRPQDNVVLIMNDSALELGLFERQ
ncbi:hypothetical protein [Komagataeibacter oboediens]|uniref:hypothetical protein n=1 Tax=Komagataeibacter oboediens TaxID=65958 RepID=UPI0011B81816|nr:hypothetical protein [Komagataeibacter oboediens]